MKKIVALSLLLVLQGCNDNDDKSSNRAVAEKTAEHQVVEQESAIAKPGQAMTAEQLKQTLKDQMQQQGKVVHLTMEGGFFGIVTQDGRKLLPMNLPKQLQQDGAIIQFSGKVVTDIQTIQQWGVPFKLKNSKLIQPGSVKTSDI